MLQLQLFDQKTGGIFSLKEEQRMVLKPFLGRQHVSALLLTLSGISLLLMLPLEPIIGLKL